MNEAEWLRAIRVHDLLDHVRRKASERKCRLFTCACCRVNWHRITDASLREVVGIAERIADGLASPKTARLRTAEAMARARGLIADYLLDGVAACGQDDAYVAAVTVPSWFKVVPAAPQRAYAALFRHIVGNPFRSVPGPAYWPASIPALADALYNGTDCAFALHDALLDAGHTELAEHFQQESWHPKGCWVVDLVLGKS